MAAVRILRIDVGVLNRIRMADWTVSLGGIIRCARFTTHNVLARCHSLKMIWVNAFVNAAQVVNLFPFRDVSAKHEIGDAMSGGKPAHVPELSVMLRCVAASPEPAASRRDGHIGKESLHIAHPLFHAVKYSEVEA